MSEWNIPTLVELFTNVPASYSICDRAYVGDNIYAMGLFLDAVNVPAEMVETDDGTQVVLNNGARRIVIDSGGLGDFHLHGYDVSEAEPAAQMGSDAPVTCKWTTIGLALAATGCGKHVVVPVTRISEVAICAHCNLLVEVVPQGTALGGGR